MRFFGRKKKEEREEKIHDLEEMLIPDLEEILRMIQEAKETAGEKKQKEGAIEEIAPGHYKVKHVASSTKASEAEHSDTKEKKEEKKEAEPLNRDEILLEILKELKELNSNVKAMIVRMDVSREEIRELIGYAVDRIEGRIISSGGC